MKEKILQLMAHTKKKDYETTMNNCIPINCET